MPDVVIKGVETAEEQEAVNDLMTKVHYPGYYPVRAQLDSFLANHPEYLREHTRFLSIDGQLASCLCLFTYTIRIGEARMKLGGIGNVTTSGLFRQKGYAALLMHDTMRYLKARGYHLSMLFGIADFYHRWGFASVLPEYVSAITLREAAQTAVKTQCKERRMKPGDIPAVLLMHNQGDTNTSCSIIRSSGHFSNRWDRWKEARVLTDSNGRVAACYLGRPVGGEFHIDELNVSDTTWYPALLRACFSRAKAEYATSMRFNMPPSHPFSGFLMQYRSDHEIHVFRNSNGMIAAVNIEEILECMTAEWEFLLSTPSAKDISATATLVIDNAPYRIRSHHGMISVAASPGENKLGISGAEFIQLLTGYRGIDEIISSKHRALRVPAKMLLRILFPKRIPYVWLLDRF